MSNITFGEVSYDDVGSKGKNFQSSKDLYLKLTEGENDLRLLTLPLQYSVHTVKKDPEDKKDYGQKVLCSKPNGYCPMCESGEEPKYRWLYGTIDRKTQSYKILDVGWGVFDKIKKLAGNKRWGDPQKYDISILRDKDAGPANFYSVQPIEKMPLSADDQKIKDQMDMEDLKRRCQPYTPEQVQKRLDRIFGVENAVLPKLKAKAEAAQPSRNSGTNPASLDDDTDEDFPAFK
jgi:hypothetical protein